MNKIFGNFVALALLLTPVSTCLEATDRCFSNGILCSSGILPKTPQTLEKKGLCIYLIGLSGSGKSTIAQNLKAQLENIDPFRREVIILDGDEIRKHLSSELGFSKKDRSLNVRRIGYVASLIAKCGGICICANIAPYEEDRLANRELISLSGTYFEVYVNTPLEVCEQRDVKGLYKLAREGKIKEFTGISDPFEIPTMADFVVSGAQDSNESTNKVLSVLTAKIPYLHSEFLLSSQ